MGDIEQALTPPDRAQLRRLEDIFMPYATAQKVEARRRQGIEHHGNLRFVHYTSADAALSILRSKRLWLRNTQSMVDYREVRHGYDMLHRHFNTSGRRERFIQAFAFAPGVAEEALRGFDGWWSGNNALNIYVASLSEHDRSEDQHGRLSMWRGFGNPATPRVAMVLSVPRESEALFGLKSMFSPVGYLTDAELDTEMAKVLGNIEREADYLKTVPPSLIRDHVFGMLYASVTCLKHEGFKEEKEWRVVYHPQIARSSHMELDLVSVNGVPQNIYKLPLDAQKDVSLEDLDMMNMLERIIIGPSAYPFVLYQAFVEVLRNELSDPGATTRVVVSGIPIRS